MRSIHRILFLFAAVVLSALVSLSQETSEDKKSKAAPGIEVKTNLMVLDANNAYITDVKAEDLKIFEDDVEQKVRSIARRDLKLQLVLVLDNTGSMKTALPKIENAAGTVVVNLGEKDEAMIIRFVDSSKIEVIEEWTSDKAKLLDSIKNKLYIEGGQSAIIDAVYLAAENLKQRKGTGQKAILLMTDGEERVSFYTRKQLLKHLAGTDIRVFPIALTAYLKDNGSYPQPRNPKEVAEKLITALGSATGGLSYLIDKNVDEGITAALRSIMIELRSQFIISYVSSNQKRDTTRKLRVEVANDGKGQKRQGHIRESIYVAKD